MNVVLVLPFSLKIHYRLQNLLFGLGSTDSPGGRYYDNNLPIILILYFVVSYDHSNDDVSKITLDLTLKANISLNGSESVNRTIRYDTVD